MMDSPDAYSCRGAALELTLQGTVSKLRLHAADYSRVQFAPGSWKPHDPFNPCQQLQTHQAVMTFRSFQGSP
ncbi:MAG: hypothetical protein LAN62_04905 [Acidobacteriia bacterium]|nr:hypothetical protein [Terriglobia bacterium]